MIHSSLSWEEKQLTIDPTKNQIAIASLFSKKLYGDYDEHLSQKKAPLRLSAMPYRKASSFFEGKNDDGQKRGFVGTKRWF